MYNLNNNKRKTNLVVAFLLTVSTTAVPSIISLSSTLLDSSRAQLG